MVLDEDALERMLARQRDADGRTPAAQAQLTQETDEFEVYERPSDDDESSADVEPPAPEPMAADPGTMAPPEPVAADRNVQAPPRPQVMPPLATHAPEPEHEAPAVPDEPAATPEPAVPATTPNTDGGSRIGIVHCMFNHEITDRMVASAIAKADQLGATIAATVQVAGVFDAPLAAQRLARSGNVDAVVVIGCVVKGDTDHDQVITAATAQSLQAVALATDVPVGLGVTGPGMSWAEAEARIDNAAHAVEAVVALVGLQV